MRIALLPRTVTVRSREVRAIEKDKVELKTKEFDRSYRWIYNAERSHAPGPQSLLPESLASTVVSRLHDGRLRNLG